ncbi:unnamed protein product, partial [Polarella glacialis]
RSSSSQRPSEGGSSSKSKPAGGAGASSCGAPESSRSSEVTSSNTTPSSWGASSSSRATPASQGVMPALLCALWTRTSRLLPAWPKPSVSVHRALLAHPWTWLPPSTLTAPSGMGLALLVVAAVWPSRLQWLLYLLLALGLCGLQGALHWQEAQCLKIEAQRQRTQEIAQGISREADCLCDKVQEVNLKTVRASGQRWRLLQSASPDEAVAEADSPKVLVCESLERRATTRRLKRSAEALLLCLQWASSRIPWRAPPGSPRKSRASFGQEATTAVSFDYLSPERRRSVGSKSKSLSPAKGWLSD